MTRPIIIMLAGILTFVGCSRTTGTERTGQDDRKTWISLMDRICSPVILGISGNTLRENMPVETKNRNPEEIRKVTHLEALGRTFTGMAAWLELGPDETEEGQLRKFYIDHMCLALANATSPSSPDYLNFSQGKQPLVDAAFLAHGLLRARTQIWERLTPDVQQRLIDELISTRNIRPYENNWLLFSAMIECALKEFTGEWEYDRVETAVLKHEEWYKGDGWYGDGKNFHLDYYNSFVIQPMLMQILDIAARHVPQLEERRDIHQARYARYASQLEMLVSPEGTVPAFGRSLAYRFGMFHALSDAAYRKILPAGVSPAQVRCAMTSVMTRQADMPDTFDSEGWLTVGFAGHQPSIGETYISTGSLYLCSAAFIALGLPPEDPFWAAPAEDWTQKKIWNGKDHPCDKALKK